MTEYRDLETQKQRLRIWVNKDQPIPFVFSNTMGINPTLHTTWHFFETSEKVDGADLGLDELEDLKELVRAFIFFHVFIFSSVGTLPFFNSLHLILL